MARSILSPLTEQSSFLLALKMGVKFDGDSQIGFLQKHFQQMDLDIVFTLIYFYSQPE